MIPVRNCTFLRYVCDKKIIAYASHNPIFIENTPKNTQKPSFCPYNALFLEFCTQFVYVEMAI